MSVALRNINLVVNVRIENERKNSAGLDCRMFYIVFLFFYFRVFLDSF